MWGHTGEALWAAWALALSWGENEQGSDLARGPALLLTAFSALWDCRRSDGLGLLQGLTLLVFSFLFQRVWQWELDSELLENPHLRPSKAPGKPRGCFCSLLVGFCAPLPLGHCLSVRPTLLLSQGGWRCVD